MTKVSIKKILLIVILIFGVWNLSWFCITTIKYNKFVKVIPKNKWGLHFIEKEDGYLYNVKKPSYLSFTGNLGVSNKEKGEILIIWPLISGGYEYGFRLQKDGVAYEIYVDENMEPIDKNNSVATQNVKENKAELEKLFSKANKMWQLK